MLAATAGAAIYPFASGVASEVMVQARNGTGELHLSAGAGFGALVELAPLLGLFCLPMLLALVPRPSSELRFSGRTELIPVAFAAGGLAAAALSWLRFGVMIWPGDVWSISGLGPIHLVGAKPWLYPVHGFYGLEILATITFLALLAWRRRAWTVRTLGLAGVFLALIALAQLPPMALNAPIDRYFIPVAGVLAPLMAAMVSRPQVDAHWATVSRAWAVAWLVLGVAAYTIGQQDYQAWHSAVDVAALMAYSRAEPELVDAGFEAMGVYVLEPDVAATGHSRIDYIRVHPRNPVLRLEFAPPDDPRPGAVYRSLRSGKVVIVCVKPGAPCP
jgi:hypothetical protein